MDQTLLIAILGPTATLLGVFLAQSVVVWTTWVRARADLRSAARSAVEIAQKAFADFQAFAGSSISVTKNGPTLDQILEEEWLKSAEIVRRASALIPHARYARAIQTANDAISQAHELALSGGGIGENVRHDSYLAAEIGFEVTSALLRNGRVPRRIMRNQRRLRNDLLGMYADWNELHDLNKGKKAPPSGVVTVAHRRVRQHVKKWARAAISPVARFWRFLFAP